MSDGAYPELTLNYGGGLAVMDGSATLNGGYAPYEASIAQNYAHTGGGVYASFNALVTITNTVISGNTAIAGGGVYVASLPPSVVPSSVTGNQRIGAASPATRPDYSVTLNYCQLTSNAAEAAGGAVYNGGTLYVNGCTISENQATNGYGAGIANYGTATVNYTDITDNTALSGGGGILNGSHLTITNSLISGNSAPSGAGISNGGYANIVACTLSGNSAASNGGAIDNYGSAYIESSVLVGNVASDSGGAVNNQSGGIATIINSTLTDNQAGQYGGAAENAGTLTIANSILVNDSAGTANPEIGNADVATLDVNFTDIDGGYAGTSSINADPQFIRSPSPGADGVWGTADDDYGDLHLQFTSPCIDAGNNAAVPTGVTTDLDGNARIFDFPGAHDPGAIVDMGAYELGLNLDQVIVPAGQTVALPTGGYDFTANKLTIGTGGTLDVADDSLGVTYSPGNSQASQIAGWIASGYNAGQWNGTGIVSTDTLGQPANLTGVGYFDDGTQVKIRRSWYGDTNLDGQINADDYALILLGQQTHQTNWQSGNFNYDTKVNADDWMTFILGASYSNGQKLFNSSAAIPAARSNSLLDSPTPLV